MTHTLSPVLRVGQWLLPWVVVVFAWAAIAHAISVAPASDASAVDPRPGLQVAVSTGEATGERCPPIGGGYGSYVDSLIVAESRQIACGQTVQSGGA